MSDFHVYLQELGYSVEEIEKLPRDKVEELIDQYIKEDRICANIVQQK